MSFQSSLPFRTSFDMIFMESRMIKMCKSFNGNGIDTEALITTRTCQHKLRDHQESSEFLRILQNPSETHESGRRIC